MTNQNVGVIGMLLVVLSTPAASQRANEQVSIERIMSPNEVSADLTRMATVRDSLLASAPAKQTTGEFVTVTLSDGALNGVRATLTARPVTAGQWKVERIDGGADHGSQTTTRTLVRTYMLAPITSRQIEGLLAERRLFEEVDGEAGLCTGSSMAAVEIVSNGRRRSAIRISCPDHDITDVTEQLIEAVLMSQAPLH